MLCKSLGFSSRGKTRLLKHGGHYHRCRKCLQCRISKREQWKARMLLEAHGKVCSFVTATYDDENLKSESLVPADATKFIKRLRKQLEPDKIRYSYTGEYGTENERPHFHFLFYGLPPCHHGRSHRWLKFCCPVCALLRKTWPYGDIQSKSVVPERIAYIVGHQTRIMQWDHEDKRVQPYTRHSSGIGREYIDQIAETCKVHHSQDLDVPGVVYFGGEKLHLDSYSKKRIRKALGRDEKTPEIVLSALHEEMVKDYEAEKIQNPIGFPIFQVWYKKKYAQNIKNREGKHKRTELNAGRKFDAKTLESIRRVPDRLSQIV